MLAVAGGKGGTGKTTTTLALAAAYGRRRRRVLAVDADADAPNLHLAAGVDAGSGLAALADGRDPWAVARPVPDTPGVWVVPARPGAPVEDALATLRGVDATVLVDCPAGAGPDAVTPLRAADSTLLVTTPTRHAVADTVKTAAMARALDTTVTGILVTHTESSPQRFAPAFDAPVLGATREPDSQMNITAASTVYDAVSAGIGPNP